MANDARTDFVITKRVVGGIRNDSAPTTTDEEAAALRLNSNSELIVSIGSGTATIAIEGNDDHDEAISGSPILIGVEAADFDGAALPNAVDAEGDAVRLKASLSGVQYYMPVNENGSATPLAPEGTAAGEGFQISLDDGTDSVFAQGDTTGNLRAVGSVAHDAVDSGDPVKIGFQAITALPTAVAGSDRVNSVADVYGRQMTAPYDLTNQADRITRENPEWAQNEHVPIVDITNGDSDPAANGGLGTIYDYYFSPESFGKFTLHCLFNGGTDSGSDTGITMRIYGIWQDDGTAKESCDEEDLSLSLLSAATFNVACGASNTIVVNDNGGICQNCKWVHIELYVDATDNTADWTIWKGQRYI
jgi:hypothetical protein